MRSIYLLLFVLPFLKAGAQQATDSILYARSIATVLDDYKKEIQGNLHLYNGIEYLRADHGVKGTPFFIADTLLPGAIFYDGTLYDNVPLHYDIVSDDIIINNFAQNNQLKLVPEKIISFSLAAHEFVRITADSTFPSFITTGFYEKLYDGNKMTVFARRQKIARPVGVGADAEIRFNEYNYYYVLLNNTFYRADDKSDFLGTMADKKDAIKKYIKENNINFKKKREASMVQVAEYYSQLKD